MTIKEIIHGFYITGIIKFGDFTLKDGTKSQYYIDLRLLLSYPWLLRLVCAELQTLIEERNLECDAIAGIPLAGIPIATLVSSGLDVCGLLIRKEAKEYGCKNAIEGNVWPGQKVLLIDDVVTSASSKRETISILNRHDLVCEDIVVVVDRRRVVDTNLRIHSLLTMPEIIGTLLSYDLLEEEREKLLEIQKTFD